MPMWESLIDVFVSSLQRIADALTILGPNRWAAAIVVLTIAVRTLLLPVAAHQIRMQLALGRLGPELARLKRRFGSDRGKLVAEQAALYRREGVSPAGGLLVQLAQLPVMIAMYHAIRRLADSTPRMPFFGLGNLTDIAMRTPIGVVLLVVYGLAGLLAARQLYETAAASPRTLLLVPLLAALFLLRFPSGLLLYWTTQQVYQLAHQTVVLRRRRN